MNVRITMDNESVAIYRECIITLADGLLFLNVGSESIIPYRVDQITELEVVPNNIDWKNA